MKFFFEFVSCYWYPSASASDVLTKAEEPRAKQTVSLVTGEGQKKRRRKQGYASAAARPEWKPSLGAISEEKIVVVFMERDRKDEDPTVRSRESVKSRGRSRPTRSAGGSFRRDPVAMVIPAFSPAPFVF